MLNQKAIIATYRARTQHQQHHFSIGEYKIKYKNEIDENIILYNHKKLKILRKYKILQVMRTDETNLNHT